MLHPWNVSLNILTKGYFINEYGGILYMGIVKNIFCIGGKNLQQNVQYTGVEINNPPPHLLME